MRILVEKLSSCCDHFLRLSGFLDLSGKVLLVQFKFSLLDYSTMVSRKLPPRKFTSIKLPPGKFPPEKFPPRKSPPGIFAAMFLNIPTWVFKFLFFHYFHRHHWYYLQDCLVILCFKSAEVTNSEVDVSKNFSLPAQVW